MVHIYHNLPDEPYKKFFGRQESIEKMWETLIEGGTFIASIDGVGGIGKTALAYYFCKEILIPRKVFDYIVWFTVKDTVFDPFSNEQLIKRINVNFRGVEGLIDTILGTVGFEDIIQNDFNEKKNFLEDEILGKEKIFIVIDNIETIEDDTFFSYITKDFNRISYYNRNLKILTTSRKRKKIADFPIEIEGLQIEDALKMLKYLAKEYKIKDIINATDHDNIKLLEKVGCIPLGIEFIIGQ
ncbi:MAG: NB-ARC domain-containing protein, partial [Candidatus Calescibacterium sp.]|nr:NB-ARC domain-containing protein [Candidatus Calescibacterium sp.]